MPGKTETDQRLPRPTGCWAEGRRSRSRRDGSEADPVSTRPAKPGCHRHTKVTSAPGFEAVGGLPGEILAGLVFESVQNVASIPKFSIAEEAP